MPCQTITVEPRFSGLSGTTWNSSIIEGLDSGKCEY